MYLWFSSVAHVRAGDDVLRVDHLRGPLLFRILSRVSKIGPLLVSRPSIMLCEVVDDAVRRGTSPRRGIDLPVEHGAVCRF